MWLYRLEVVRPRVIVLEMQEAARDAQLLPKPHGTVSLQLLSSSVVEL